MALAHVERDEVRGAYNSALYLTPRRRMLQAWTDTVEVMIEDGDAAIAAEESPDAQAYLALAMA